MVLTLGDDGIYKIKQACYLDEKVKVNILDDCYVDLKEFCENNNIIVEKDRLYKMLMEEKNNDTK